MGSRSDDEMVVGDDGHIDRLTNRAGGIEGGMSNGQPIRVRAAMKPIPSIPKALRTVDVATGEAAQAINQRSDSTAVPAAAVVVEAMVRLTLARELLEKFGGDSVDETRRNLEGYLALWSRRWCASPWPANCSRSSVATVWTRHGATLKAIWPRGQSTCGDRHGHHST